MTDQPSPPTPDTRTYALAAIQRLPLDAFAREVDLHPQHITRLVTLGLVDAEPGPDGEPRFEITQVAVVARIRRLRAGLGISYAAIGTVLHLLDRVADLETQLRTQARPPQRMKDQ